RFYFIRTLAGTHSKLPPQLHDLANDMHGLFRDLSGSEVLGIVCWVIGQEPHTPVRFFFQAFDRGAVSVNQGNDRVSGLRVILLSYDDHIAIPDAGLHGAALDPQAKK